MNSYTSCEDLHRVAFVTTSATYLGTNARSEDVLEDRPPAVLVASVATSFPTPEVRTVGIIDTPSCSFVQVQILHIDDPFGSAYVAEIFVCRL